MQLNSLYNGKRQIGSFSNSVDPDGNATSWPGPILWWRLIMKKFLVILLPSAAFRKGCCQLQVKVCARSTG